MNENFNDTEFCSVCGGTFRGSRSHRDKPYKTCKNCLDREELKTNMSKELIDRIDGISHHHADDGGVIENKNVINKFDKIKKYLGDILDIDIVSETKIMKNHFSNTFYNVEFNNMLAKKIHSFDSEFIISPSNDKELVIFLRK